MLFHFSYQYGPDTYLMQVKDAGFPARLREYLTVAKQTSAEFQDVKVIFLRDRNSSISDLKLDLFLQCPIIKERRRFTDVMEEESVNQRESRLTAWGRDDFSVYKMHKAGAQESVEIQVKHKDDEKSLITL